MVGSVRKDLDFLKVAIHHGVGTPANTMAHHKLLKASNLRHDSSVTLIDDFVPLLMLLLS